MLLKVLIIHSECAPVQPGSVQFVPLASMAGDGRILDLEGALLDGTYVVSVAGALSKGIRVRLWRSGLTKNVVVFWIVLQARHVSWCLVSMYQLAEPRKEQYIGVYERFNVHVQVAVLCKMGTPPPLLH